VTPPELLAIWDRAVQSHREFMTARGFQPYERVMVEVKNSARLRECGLDSPLTVGGYGE
jgi:hypothetical protein